MQPTNDVNRLNYGVYFAYKDTITPVTRIWRHTFSIPLPPRRFLYEFTDEYEHVNFTDYARARDFFTRVRRPHMDGQTKTAKNPTDQSKLQQLVVDILRNYLVTINEQLDMIYDILPGVYLTTPLGRNNTRTQRALIPVVGTILKSLFGTSTSEDTDALKKHVMEIAKTQSHEIEIMKKESTAIRSFVTQSTDKLNNLAETVKADLVANINLIHAEAEAWRESVSYTNRMLGYISNLQHNMHQLSLNYAELLGALESLINGKVSPMLIPARALFNVMARIRRDVSQEDSTIVFDDPSFYYHKGTFVFAREGEVLYITLQFPMSTFENMPFDVFEIRSFPMVLPNSDNNVMNIKGLPRGLVIHRDREYFYTLTQVELEDIGVHHHAHPRTIFSKVKKGSCLTAIFYDEGKDVDKFCSYEITTNGLQPVISLIRDSTYFLVNIENYTLQCDDHTKVVPGCRSCMITLPPRCRLQHNDWMVPMTKFDGQETSAIDQTHVLNIPLLMQFFDNTTLAALRGDDFFATEPNITLPDFKYFSHEITNTFATQDQMSHDLAKTAQAVLNNRYIVDNLGQSLILGDVELDKDLFWFSAKGLVVEISLTISVCLLIVSVYFYFRLRKLTIALLLLQAGGLPRTEARSDGGLVLNYFEGTTPDVDPKSVIDVQLLIQEWHSSNWPFVYIGIATTIIVYFVGRKLYKRARRYCPNTNNCFLALEFVQNGNVLMIPLIKLQGTPVQYLVSANEFIDNVRVSGWCRPTMEITWPSLQITSKLTGATIPVESHIALSIIASYHLKRIISKNFQCYPLWTRGQERFRIELARHEGVSPQASLTITPCPRP
jgi:hypothetical protein